MRLAFACVMLCAGIASAQPPAAPPPPPDLWEIKLVDGQTVDARIVSQDAYNVVVQTPQGSFTIARQRIVSMVHMGAVIPTVPAPSPKDAPEKQPPTLFRAALMLFAGVYIPTVVVSLAARGAGGDPDAIYGVVPVAGPLWWASRDEGKLGSDGWDYLALLPTLAQALTLGGAINGLMTGERLEPDKKKKKRWSLAPYRSPTRSGFAISGRF